MTVRIGTRGSQLALWQAKTVAAAIVERGGEAEIVVVKTSGDRLAEAPLSEAGGKRLFVKEIEEALLEGRVDIAVHSAKDMPTDMPDALAIGAVLPREEPWDALVLPLTPTLSPQAGRGGRNEGDATSALDDVLRQLGPAPRIGTSSVRRITQLHRLMPGATFHPIRGNLDTRLRKLDDGQHDVIVLACAGLVRLGWSSRISARLPITVSVPSPGQGAIAVQIARRAPAELASLVASLDDAVTRAAITAERLVIEVLGGGCQTPIGALAQPIGGGDLELQAAVTSFEGVELRAVAFGHVDDPAGLGARVGAKLLAEGAAELLDASAVEPRED